MQIEPFVGPLTPRVASRLLVLLIAAAAGACDASTPSEVSENLDREGAGGVAFSDPQLEAVVRQVLGLGDAVVTEAALEALTGLSAPETGITSLDGLEHAVNLEELILSGNAVRDLQPLTALTGLRRLDLTGNGLTDTDAAHLAEMLALETLRLDANELEDLGMLQTLEKLQVLSLAGNRISEFGPLSELSALSVVDLSRNHIHDLASPDGPAAPVGLLLEDNEITDLGPLLGHDGLRDQAAHVGLAGNPLSEESRCDHVPALGDAGLTIRGAAPCPGAPEGEAMFITTDRSVYVSEHHHISTTFSHLGADVLHGNKCSDGPEWEWQFQIEKLVDGDWAVGHEPARLLCLNPQQVHPGDEVSFVPFSIGASTGTYRLTWPWIFEDPDKLRRPHSNGASRLRSASSARDRKAAHAPRRPRYRDPPQHDARTEARGDAEPHPAGIRAQGGGHPRPASGAFGGRGSRARAPRWPVTGWSVTGWSVTDPDLVGRFAATFDRAQVTYMVTGGVASVVYGDPRFTRDVDLVAELDADSAFSAASTIASRSRGQT